MFGRRDETNNTLTVDAPIEPQLNGEEQHGLERLERYQRAKRAYTRAKAVLADATQVEAETKEVFDRACLDLRRVAEAAR